MAMNPIELDNLLSEIRQLTDRIDKQFCICDEAYTGRGLIDPYCQAHDIAEFITEWVDNELVNRAGVPLPPAVDILPGTI